MWIVNIGKSKENDTMTTPNTTDLLNACLETNLPAALAAEAAEAGDAVPVTDSVWTPAALEVLHTCAANLHPETAAGTTEGAADGAAAGEISDTPNEETAEVWNPIHDRNRVDRWAEFSLPNTRLYKNDPRTRWMMLVYQNQNDRILYFFSNDVAWNLGHEMPHEAVENLVPARNKKSIPIGSGIFLTKEGVQEFIDVTPDNQDKTVFVAWFDAYVKKCEFNTEINLENTCPA